MSTLFNLNDRNSNSYLILAIRHQKVTTERLKSIDVEIADQSWVIMQRTYEIKLLVMAKTTHSTVEVKSAQRINSRTKTFDKL